MNKAYLFVSLVLLSILLVSCVPTPEISLPEENESSESVSSLASEESAFASDESEIEFVSEASLEEKVSLPFVPFD
ncbi:MAG: hypothetical protein E7614_04060 [Ruminococcaceae bacterium]|nr:hypothetical protein [Oscillospiraceae bacterium]